MGARGVCYILRQICRTLLGKDTKESFEYIGRTCQPRRESPQLAAVRDAARTTRVGEVGEIVMPYIFVR
jgi:hypothetical protein